FGIGFWVANIPVLKARLDVNDAHLGLIFAAIACGTVAAMPLAGMASDVLGSRGVVIWGAFAFPVALGLCLLIHSQRFIIETALLLGLSNGVFDTSAKAHCLTYYRSLSHENSLSRYQSLFGFGILSGVISGSRLTADGKHLTYILALTLVMASAGFILGKM